MADVEATEIIKRLDQLISARSNWDSMWQTTAEVTWPDASDFRNRREPGSRRTAKLFDSTATDALEKFAAVMESLLTPRQQKWHTLKASDDDLNDDPGVKLWFEEVSRALFTARNSPRANYYSQKHEGYKSLGAFGNECLFIDENPNGGIRYRNFHIGQTFIETDPQGMVDTLYRKYELSAKAAMQRWGERAPERIQKSVETQPFQRFEFVHAVMPNPSPDPGALDHAGMPVRSFEIAIQDQQLLEVGGYHELPYKFARYTVNSREMYGRGPAQLVLPSILMVQEMQKTFIRAGHIVVNPPLLAHDDSVMGAGSNQIDMRPGRVTWGGLDAQGNQTIKPFISGARLDLTEGMLATERKVIKDVFLVPAHEALEQHPQMTATQVLALLREKGIIIAPMIGRQQSEMLGPQIEREIGILLRQGFLPPVPPVLEEAEGEYEIQYESSGMRQQRLEEALGVERTIEGAAPFIAADPTLLDIFKPVEIVRLYADIHGAPTSILRTDEELAEIAKRRESEQGAQQTVDALPALSKAAKDLAEAGAVTTPRG
jgi:hypothetical protein